LDGLFITKITNKKNISSFHVHDDSEIDESETDEDDTDDEEIGE